MKDDEQQRTTLIAAAAAVGVALDISQADRFLHYLKLLRAFAKRGGLTAITRPAEIINRHFIDSLLALKVPIRIGASLVDVGSGAGFPGIPLRIVRPDLATTLLESSRRRVAFLERVAVELGLEMRIAVGRAEQAGHWSGWRESFDVATVRAVAKLAVACELTLPLVRVGGMSVVLKGPRARDEVVPGSRAATRLGGGTLQLLKDRLPGGEERIVIVIPKVTQTPDVYPRRPGIPSRDPLG